jgi:hypothetical protein
MTGTRKESAMTIPVYIEPTATGFRATTGGPWNLIAEAPTSELALAGVRQQIRAKQAAGGKIVHLPVGKSALELAAERLAANPLLDEFDKAVAEARREMEAEEEAREREREAANGSVVPPGSNPAPAAVGS